MAGKSHTLCDNGGVRGRVGDIGALAVSYRRDAVSCTAGQRVGFQRIAVRGDVFHGKRHGIGTVIDVDERDLHPVGYHLIGIVRNIGYLHIHSSVERVPQVVDDGGVLGAREGVGGGGGGGHGVGGVIEVGEGEDLHQVLPIAVAYQVVHVALVNFAAR